MLGLSELTFKISKTIASALSGRVGFVIMQVSVFYTFLLHKISFHYENKILFVVTKFKPRCRGIGSHDNVVKNLMFSQWLMHSQTQKHICSNQQYLISWGKKKSKYACYFQFRYFGHSHCLETYRNIKTCILANVSIRNSGND